MTKGKMMFSWIVCLFFIFIFSGLIVQDLSAKAMSNFTLNGKWTEGSRSLSPTIPVSVFITGEILSIQSSTQRSDITLRISKDGTVLFEQTIQSSDTHCIMVELSDYEPDVYTIELTNQWGDYLHGEFEKEY